MLETDDIQDEVAIYFSKGENIQFSCDAYIKVLSCYNHS